MSEIYSTYLQMKGLVYGPTINEEDRERKKKFLELAQEIGNNIAHELGMIDTVASVSNGNDATSGEVTIAGYLPVEPGEYHDKSRTIYPVYILFLQPEVSSSIFMDYTEIGMKYTPRIIAKFMPHGKWHSLSYADMAEQEYSSSEYISALRVDLYHEYNQLFWEAIQVNEEIDKAWQ